MEYVDVQVGQGQGEGHKATETENGPRSLQGIDSRRASSSCLIDSPGGAMCC